MGLVCGVLSWRAVNGLVPLRHLGQELRVCLLAALQAADAVTDLGPN